MPMWLEPWRGGWNLVKKAGPGHAESLEGFQQAG